MDEAVTIDFSRVSRELRSIIARRRELILFLGSLFAGAGIYLQNILEGKLPDSLKALEQSAFLTFSLALLAASTVIALRLSKLHFGMTLNGILFKAALQSGGDASYDPLRGGKLNWAGVSTQFFLLTAVIAGFSAGLLALSRGLPWPIVVAAGAGVTMTLVLMHLAWHRKGARFALGMIQNARYEPVNREELEDHISESLRDGNHDMTTCVSFAGLMLFSILQGLSGLGAVQAKGIELTRETLQREGSLALSLLLLVTCLLVTVVYLRLFESIGTFSIQLDPTDRPFRLFKLTDSFLGLLLMILLLAASVHLVAVPLLAWCGLEPSLAWMLDAGVAAAVLGVYAVWMLILARRHHR
jgi:hypothetical protein